MDEVFPPNLLKAARRFVERTSGPEKALLLEALDLNWEGAEPPVVRRIGDLPSVRRVDGSLTAFGSGPRY